MKRTTSTRRLARIARTAAADDDTSAPDTNSCVGGCRAQWCNVSNQPDANSCGGGHGRSAKHEHVRLSGYAWPGTGEQSCGARGTGPAHPETWHKTVPWTGAQRLRM